MIPTFIEVCDLFSEAINGCHRTCLTVNSDKPSIQSLYLNFGSLSSF
jgi:hypothetical protein